MILSVFDCMDENLIEIESSDSGIGIGGSQETDHRSGASCIEQSGQQVTPVVSGYCGGKLEMKIWLLVGTQ
jgi:hypothetical protein